MKKIIILVFCLVFALSGCEEKQKAEAFYSDTTDAVVLETEYDYYFSDETNIFCFWINSSEENIFFHDTFELHELGGDGEWYLIGNPEDADFYTEYKHFVEPGEKNQSRSRYDISIYTNSLKEGSTYRISTYCFDGSGNYYQVFSEFTCDNDLAEAEMLEITDGMFKDRDGDFPVENFNTIDD